MDISKYFRKSLGIRDNESRLSLHRSVASARRIRCSLGVQYTFARTLLSKDTIRERERERERQRETERCKWVRYIGNCYCTFKAIRIKDRQTVT